MGPTATRLSSRIHLGFSTILGYAGGLLEVPLKHVVHHGLGFEKAKKVAEAAVGSYSERFKKYDPKVSWKTDRRAEIGFTVKGISLQGVLEVGDKDIEMDLEVPFLLRPFKGTALSVIDEEIKKWLAKAKAGEI